MTTLREKFSLAEKRRKLEKATRLKEKYNHPHANSTIYYKRINKTARYNFYFIKEGEIYNASKLIEAALNLRVHDKDFGVYLRNQYVDQVIKQLADVLYANGDTLYAREL